jgi:hypothetical protein
MTAKKPVPESNSEDWAKFERAVDVVVKSGPIHRSGAATISEKRRRAAREPIAKKEQR